jgi:hypothetical protein
MVSTDLSSTLSNGDERSGACERRGRKVVAEIRHTNCHECSLQIDRYLSKSQGVKRIEHLIVRARVAHRATCSVWIHVDGRDLNSSEHAAVPTRQCDGRLGDIGVRRLY